MPSVRRVSWAKFRVSAVCLVAFLILLTLIYLLTGGQLLQPKATIYMFVRDATGLSAGSPVRVDGIGVGKVTSLNLSSLRQPNREVQVTITIERDRLATIPVDSFAVLSTDTLIGDKFVDITSGRAVNHIAPNGEIKFKDQPELMTSLDLSQFQKQLREVDATLSDIEQGKGLVGQFVLGEEVYSSLLKELGDFEKEVHVIADANGSLGKALYSDEIYRQYSEPVVEFDRALARIQSGQGSAGQLFHDTAQYEQLRANARDLQHSLSELRAQDFMRSDAQYVEWNRMVTSLIRSVEEMNANSQLNRSEMYDSLNGFAKEVRDTVKEFREHPSKFLRINFF